MIPLRQTLKNDLVLETSRFLRPTSQLFPSLAGGGVKGSLSCLCILLLLLSVGCSAIPDVRHKPQYHNPFPQLTRIGILPFRNQSEEPTLSGARVSLAYYNELQSIPGFEVIPLGVVETQLAHFETHVIQRPLASSEDMGVDAVLQGAITDYYAYYPPRMTLKVNWYAANPGLHPIPVGYGLPWGTKEEKKIPEWIRLESERELAKEQIATQTPVFEEVGSGLVDSKTQVSPQTKPKSTSESTPTASDDSAKKRDTIASARILLPQPVGSVRPASFELPDGPDPDEPPRMPAKLTSLEDQPPVIINSQGEFVLDPSATVESNAADPLESEHRVYVGRTSRVRPSIVSEAVQAMDGAELPMDWPDPNGFIPAAPRGEKPQFRAQHLPSHFTYEGL
jgi:hypothetical protein